ncbi:hypothetical protein E3P86_00549 [Wallemia ichthyophaga]|uniref:Uncharacterized protein n=1 Tax=Wallemia ichthyophaga TaxID=245174 RepID=A0A4T0JG89_WALIC|nr:hypothetical protein E3P86_00549 [Wallemia ichthyophaga]
MIRRNASIVICVVVFVFTTYLFTTTLSSNVYNSLKSTKSNKKGRANAAFVILTTDDDLYGILSSIRQMEDRFNLRDSGGYDYVFLNERKFSKEFKKRTSAIISTHAYYGLVSPSDWQQPSWIDEDRAAASRHLMVLDKTLHGESVPYRNMCRFFSGKFYNHPLLQPYDYYWRIEPNVEYTCDLDQDPFLALQENGSQYGFTISILEFPDTIKTLWETVKDFMKDYPEHIAANNSMGFISDNEGETYNGCHFWSNFEIGNLNFFRSKAYNDFFNYLDKRGGFYYERWGDAPVHTIAAALLLPSDAILRMEPIGYNHEPYKHCPLGKKNWNRCSCRTVDSDIYHPHSCSRKWDVFVKHRSWQIN